ncbi:MAG: homoserine kinase [Actinomycetota bacterium]|nr:homoserine kinase [Actinomycetota bacterium]
MPLLARVPATVANLGPGFDTLALALDLWNEVRLDPTAEPGVVVRGEGAPELPEDATNLVLRTMAFFSDRTGLPLPPFRLECDNRIPLERGLGSSASAVVAGVLLAEHVSGASLDPDRLLEIAVDMEGHGDNVAACLRGGGVVAYLSSTGWRAEPLRIHPSLRPVVLIPEDERLPTADARRVLPAEVPLQDAAFNAGRTALMVLALTERPELLAMALEDRLHQQRRLTLVPASRVLFDHLREAGVAVCVAGAGPSLLAFETTERPLPGLGSGWRPLHLQVASSGAEVRDMA